MSLLPLRRAADPATLPRMIRVLLVDDHPSLRFGLRVLLEQDAEITVIGEVSSGREGLYAIERDPPDVVILDCQMADMDGVTLAQTLRQRGIATRVLALSSYDDPEYVYGMVQAGALGYLLKSESPPLIVEAVKTLEHKSWFSPSVAKRLVQGLRRGVSSPLTAREQEVLRGVGRGQTGHEIAADLHLSERTVRQHVAAILQKLNVKNRTEAVVEAARRGWLNLE